MDEKAFEETVRHVRPGIESIARRFFVSLQMEDEIDDVVQEVLIVLWRHRGQIGELKNVEAWVNRVARNQCVTRFRQLKKHERVALNDHFMATDTASAGIEDKERLRTVRLLFNRLPKATRRILYLRNVEGMTLDEIATVCNRPKTSIKSSITAAKRQLITQLKKQDNAD
jgi:RNA polymerase sigma factor, sigma-70 family